MCKKTDNSPPIMQKYQKHTTLACILLLLLIGDVTAQSLPGTDLLITPDGWDCAENNIRQITDFLDAKTAESEQHRTKHWDRQFGNLAAYELSVEKNRERLRFITGVRDKRKAYDSPELVSTLDAPALIAETDTHKFYAIRWPVFDTLSGEGILAEPKSGNVTGAVIHIPDTGNTPEQVIFGLRASDFRLQEDSVDASPETGSLKPETLFNPKARSLKPEVRMVIPAIVDRSPFRPNLPYREFVYRQAFQNGRHIIGYEVQEILALVDWLKRDASVTLTVEGIGDGGLLASYSAAVDTRIDAAIVGGYFTNRNRVCEEPIDRNVFGLLDQFGDAEIATLIAPRSLTVLDVPVPELQMTEGGTPGKIVKPDVATVMREIERARKLVEPLNLPDNWIQFGLPTSDFPLPTSDFTFVSETRPNPTERMLRIVDGMIRHTQDLLARADLTRREFWKPLDEIQYANSAKFAEKLEWYRDYFANEQIGRFDDPLVSPKPRTRLKEETDKYAMYEVELDVLGGVTVYGLLLIPKGMKDGEKRAAVVCQHGLEGKPEHTLRGGADPYSGFTTDICERGYVTFAPLGIFTGRDNFRLNQRQLNPLGKTLFSIMVPQHQQVVNWLGTLPFVDKDRIAFYGLSYGGKTAMRVPPLVKGYCLSICSADFNTWNVKNASTLYPFSYVWMGEYEIFEFDLANTFDYSEMARLIAPRPFMVERGYRDGVGWDEFVAFEYAKVYDYYAYRLGMPDRTEIHWFGGGHKINGEKTYPFLDRFLTRAGSGKR